mmetsp:Transcript_2788/g.5139  ORF Transcript_2788/g.5139 Transcript_2788/m.5139 type:complete len:90 (+) Transcript_2788:1415-1684(+)
MTALRLWFAADYSKEYVGKLSARNASSGMNGILRAREPTMTGCVHIAEENARTKPVARSTRRLTWRDIGRPSYGGLTLCAATASQCRFF